MDFKLPRSAVLADASGVAKITYGLANDGFSPVDFVDFGTLIEHGVLGDIILVPGGTSVPSSMMQTMRPMLDEGIIRVLDKRPPVISRP